MFSIGMKGAARKHSIHRKGQQTLSCLHIPHFEGAVSGDNQAISTHPTAVNPIAMDREGKAFASGGSVPRLEGVVPGRGDDEAPICIHCFCRQNRPAS
ncbi:hypothetical protein KSB_90010 [Ktedonobacter robiniae]|uniref:Uncharacterized protein n=1 Tax=Ktedonobacter robiniae TaxID=2778365 RepID=A0ABQ3V6D9_9CHLR|nr:hypothetical protein KSB_90010 [Ktedonobacter robiniae]